MATFTFAIQWSANFWNFNWLNTSRELAVIVPFLLLRVQGRGILLDAGSFSGRYRGFKIGSFHEGPQVVVEVPG